MKSNKTYALLVLLGGACYGILSTFVKFAYDAGYTLAEVSGSQILIGTAVVWILLGSAIAAGKCSLKLSKKQFGSLMLTGLPMCLTTIFYYKCVSLVPASLAILLLFQFTWIGNILECIVEKKRPTTNTLLTIAVLIIGTVLASGILHSKSEVNIKGIIFGLLSALTYTAFIFFNGRTALDQHFLVKTAGMLTGASLFIIAVFPPAFLFNGALTTGLAKYGVPLAVFGVILPPILLAVGVPKIGVGLASILGSVELPVATICAALVLKEAVLLSQWIGVLIILSGVCLPLLTKKKIKQ